jgi:serine/threonine protein kinase/WD40 repeat protein
MHPNHEELLGFVLGTLQDDSADSLADHLRECNECEATIAELEGSSDTVIERLRQQVQPDQYEQESGCQSMLAAIDAIGREPTFAGGSHRGAESADPGLGMVREYKLLAKIGEGGMGAVYKALHTKLDKIVALKVLPAERTKDEQSVARFEREMRAVGKLDHPNIVRAMDAGEADGQHFLVMEYVKGSDLSQLVKANGSLPVADACELIRQAAVGLDEAHDHQMVHRDIKPSNLILAEQRRGEPIVKILDMGLALLSEAHSPEGEGLTSTGQMMGTLDYMAPEQGDDTHAVDIRADIYSLGATLYKLLCGQAPFSGRKYDTPVKKLMALATEEPQPIDQRCDDLPSGLAAIVCKMLAKNPADRYATPDEVATALTPLADSANLAALLTAETAKDAEKAEADLSAVTEDSLKSDSVETAPTIDLPSTHQLPSDSKSDLNLKDSQSPHTAASPVRPRPDLQLQPKAAPSPLRGEGRGEGRWYSNRRNQIIATAAALGGVILLGVIMLLFQTKHGTIVVKIDDPEGLIQVTVVGEDIVITEKEKSGEPIKLRPGDHKLHVQRGDLKFDTDNFTLERGKRVVLDVKLVDGKVHVVQNNKVVKSKRINEDSSDPNLLAAHWAIRLGGKVTVITHGKEYNNIGDVGKLPPPPFTYLAIVLNKNERVTDETLANMPASPLLAHVELHDTSIGDDGIKHLARNSGIQNLHVTRTRVTDAGMQYLQTLPRLAILNLSATSITDRGLQDIAKISSIRHLHLGGTQISDAGLQRITEQMPNLQYLDVAQTAVSDPGVRQIAKLKNLTGLGLSQTRVTSASLEQLRGLPIGLLTLGYLKIEDNDLIHLSTLSDLRGLQLSGTETSDSGLVHLARLKQLRSIDLRETKVTPDGIAKLKLALPGCDIASSCSGKEIDEVTATLAKGTEKELEFARWVFRRRGYFNVSKADGTGVDSIRVEGHLPPRYFRIYALAFHEKDSIADKDLELIASLPSLTSLDFIHQPITDEGLRHLRPIEKQVAFFRLYSSQVTNKGLKYIGDMTNLAVLGLSYNAITDEGIKHLESLKKLHGLELYSTKITDLGLEHLSKCTSLIILDLSHTAITDAGLAHLTDLNLTHLYVNGTAISDAGMLHLSKHAKLETLQLAHTEITNAGVAHLSDLNLKQLNANDTAISDAGVLHLSKHAKLETLHLERTKITDRGIALIADFATLRELNLVGVEQVTAAGIARIKLALPNCTIHTDFTDEAIAAAMAKLSGAILSIKLRHVLPGPEKQEPLLAFCSDGKQLAAFQDVGTTPKNVLLWDPETGKSVGKVWVGNICRVAFVPGSRQLVMADLGGGLELVNAEEPAQRKNFVGLKGPKQNVAVSLDGRYAAAIGDEGTGIWKLPGLEFLGLVDVKGRGGRGTISFSRDGDLLAISGNEAGITYVWDVQKREMRHELRGFGSQRIGRVAFSPTQNLLVGTPVMDNARPMPTVWNATTGKQLRVLDWKPIVDVIAFHPSGQRLAMASIEGDIRIVDVHTGESVADFKAHEKHIRNMQFSPDGRLLATTADDKTTKIWDVNTGTEPEFDGSAD